MLTLFWLCVAPALAPPPNVPPASAAMNSPENSSTFFKLKTRPRAAVFATPTSPMLNPDTVNGYFSPRYSSTPSPHVKPRSEERRVGKECRSRDGPQQETNIES